MESGDWGDWAEGVKADRWSQVGEQDGASRPGSAIPCCVT